MSNENFSGTLPLSATMQARFTDHDVIMAKDGAPGQLKVSNPRPHRFLARIPLPNPTGQVFIVPRDWSSVDVTSHGRTVRFANTHLEAYQAQTRQLQAAELYANLALSQRGSSAVSAEVVGEHPADRTPSGLWPSDHAGVVASLSLA